MCQGSIECRVGQRKMDHSPQEDGTCVLPEPGPDSSDTTSGRDSSASVLVAFLCLIVLALVSSSSFFKSTVSHHMSHVRVFQ